MRVTISKSTANGTIKAQPSKSYSHRLLIASALSNEECTINNVVISHDIQATIGCLFALGYEVDIEDNFVRIYKEKLKSSDEIELYCGESGSTLRFFIPIACTTGKKLIFEGDERLIERGIGPYEEIFKQQGIKYEIQKRKIIIEGKLKSGTFNLVGNISSQFISGLLFALPLLEGKSEIVLTTKLESKYYVDITLDVLRQAGINITVEDNKYIIDGNGKYNGGTYTVEGDYSNAAFIDSFNYLNGSVKIEGLNENSKQGDKIYKELFKKLNEKYQTIDVSNCIDLGPILFVFAGVKHGAHFTNVARLRIKESNRIRDIKEELIKCGIEVVETENDVYIYNQNLHAPTEELYGHNDHRIVMALSVLLTVLGGTISGTEAVKKSYPSFFFDLEDLGIEVKYE